MATITARMTENEKSRFFAMANHIGITPSNAIRILAGNFARTGILQPEPPRALAHEPILARVDTSIPSLASPAAIDDTDFGQPHLATDEAMQTLQSKGVAGPYSWRISD
jgi:hypothetical protein